jgi:hypothetical protein
MTISSAQNSNETVQGGQQPQQQHPQHHDYPPIAANERRNMDPRQSGNYLASAINQTVPQLGNSSSSNTEKQPDNNPMGSNPQPASSELNHANGDKSLILPPNGDTSNGQDTQKQAAAPAAPSDLPRRSGPRSEGIAGYERKIGRGTSWRRDHEARTEGDYTVRGRGRGAPPVRGSGRGGQYHREHDARDYPHRRDYDRRPPPPSPPLPPAPASHHHSHPSLDPRGPPYPPPDPYYDSREAYPSPPHYDSRREYPPESAARYFDDYRRGGYDPRDVPPPPPPPPPSAAAGPPQSLDSRRPYDRGPLPGREDSSEYGRPYTRPRDPRDDYPRDFDPRLPPDPRISPRDVRLDPRYIDEGNFILLSIQSLILLRPKS